MMHFALSRYLPLYIVSAFGIFYFILTVFLKPELVGIDSSLVLKSKPPTIVLPWQFLRSQLNLMDIYDGTIFVTNAEFHEMVQNNREIPAALFTGESGFTISVISKIDLNCNRGQEQNSRINVEVYQMKLSKSSSYWTFISCRPKLSSRALPKFDHDVLELDENFDLMIHKVPLFMEKLWSNSKFLECTHSAPQAANEHFKLSRKSFEYFIVTYEKLLNLTKLPFLFDGTMLGWARHCDIIKHTTDYDLAIYSETVDRTFVTQLKMERYPALSKIVNNATTILQISFDSKTDLFLLFAVPAQHGRYFTESLMYDYRKFISFQYHNISSELCTCDLRGHLFFIPCDASKYIVQQYGADWMVPKQPESWYAGSLNIAQSPVISEQERDGFWIIYKDPIFELIYKFLRYGI